MDNNYNGLEGIKRSLCETANAVKKNIMISVDIISIANSLKRFAEAVNHVGKWEKAIRKLVENQYVFTDPITNEMIERILSADEVDTEVEAYFHKDNCKHLNELIGRCKKDLKENCNYELFIQSIEAYKSNSFQLACVGLFVITDGLLSIVSKQISPSFKRRLNTIKNKFDEATELEPIDQKIVCISLALEKIDVSIFATHDFHEEELDCVNRHWTLHGRSKREYLFTDVIKVLLWIDALLFIQNIDFIEGKEKEQ